MEIQQSVRNETHDTEPGMFCVSVTVNLAGLKGFGMRSKLSLQFRTDKIDVSTVCGPGVSMGQPRWGGGCGLIVKREFGNHFG
jgi:hypothetical protein